MKKLKQWLLLFCLALGLTGCGNAGEILDEVIQSGILDEYLQPENVQKIECRKENWKSISLMWDRRIVLYWPAADILC